MNENTLIFAALAAVTLVAGWRTVTTPLITHAALWLTLSFVSVAGVFLMMKADFVAGVQVLIYAGAITTMIIFAIMLSDIKDINEREIPRGTFFQRLSYRLNSKQWGIAPLIVGLCFAIIMGAMYLRAGWTQTAQPVWGDSARAIGTELFTIHVVPFELASIILLVAMVGAIILTAKEGNER